MKKNFTKAMILTLLVAGVGMFNSCKDTDEDLYNDLRLTLQDKEADLQSVINAQAAALAELSEKLAAIKSCECDGKGYITEAELVGAIDAALTNLKDPVAQENLRKAFAQAGFVTDTTSVINIIEQYIIDNAISADQFNQLLTQAIQAGIVTGDIEKIIAGYVSKNNLVTSTEVETFINNAISTLVSQQNFDNAIDSLGAAIEMSKGVAFDSAVKVLNLAITDAVANLKTVTDSRVDSVINVMDSLIVAWGPQLQQVTQDASDALALARTDSARIDGMEAAYTDLAAKLDSIDNANNTSHDAMVNSIDSLANEMNNFATKQALRDVLTVAEALNAEAISYTKQVETRFAEKLGDLQNQYATLEGRLGKLEEKVGELKDQLDNITKKLDALTEYLNSMITNIIVQGTDNPAFGSFALPFGIQSNMLIAYYGETENNVAFPTIRTANYVYKNTALTEKDAEMLGASVESYKKRAGSVLLDDAEGNAGRIFLTVNPNTVNFEGVTFPLVNSQDEVSGMKLGALKKSDYKLQFGITRAADNGFYEATATVTEENLESVRLKKDIMGNLKSIAKDVLTPRDIDFTAIASSLYSIFNGITDANGVKATWQENGNSHSVYSTYSVAATAVQPLSYAFLYDTNLGDQIAGKFPTLPTINPITEGVLDDLINLDEINLELDLSLDLSSLDFTVEIPEANIPPFAITFPDINIDDLGQIKVEGEVDVPVYEGVDTDNDGYVDDVKQNGTTKQSFTAWAKTDDLKAKIEDAINSSLEEAGEDISAQIKEQMEDALNSQLEDIVASIETSVNDLIQNQLGNAINEQFASINGQLNGAINDVLEQVKGQIMSGVGNYIDQANGYISKVNNWSNRYNSLVEKMANYINNINTKLQVTMLYQDANGNYRQLSNSRGVPTVFTGSGATPLYLTSCSGEMLAPAVKKFVGVTNVFKAGASAQKGNAECKAALDAVNQGWYFNKVIPGNRYGIAVENLKAGYTYEIFYSALDFQGKISARKFYVTVK